MGSATIMIRKCSCTNFTTDADHKQFEDLLNVGIYEIPTCLKKAVDRSDRGSGNI